ncbi:LLM class flavin-dependent oxidoreductase [Nocardia sp. NBC_00416]|uniref:LLM class flavin-dependent oxidoreductase n=1 Tax=Nocardia sp. NBC_00416 TaxID=2975991 RepID=UPI002E220865
MPLVLGLQIPDDQLARLTRTGFGEVPELLDASGVGYIVLGADRRAAGGASLNPALLGTVFARRTRGLGIVAAAAPQRDHPFNIARRLASLDHLTRGRAGWLALRSDAHLALGATRHGSWAPAGGPVGAELLADAVTAARALWRTWPLESLTRASAAIDRTPDVEVRYADHTGAFATTGPLNVPTTPQGEPIVCWEYEPGDSGHLGVTDIAFVTPRDRAVAVPADPAVTTHVRLHGESARLRSRIAELADDAWGVTGVLVRIGLAELPGFLDTTVPALADAGLIRLRAATGAAGDAPTLRDHLGIPRRPDPDPLRFRAVYAPA